MIPQFGLLSHVSSLRLSSGLRPSPYPKHAARASLSSPHSLVADMSICATSPLTVVVRCVFCGFFFFFSLPVMLPSEIPKLPTHPPVRWFPTVSKLLLHNSLPGQVSIPNSFASLFVFFILSYLLSKRMCCLSGCLVSSTSVQKLFCRSCSAFK